MVGRHSSQCHVACVCWAIDCCNMAGKAGRTGSARAGQGRKVRRRKLTGRPHAMPKQSKSAPLPLPAGGSRAHTPLLPSLPVLARFATTPHHTTRTPTHHLPFFRPSLFRRPWLTDSPLLLPAYRRHGLDLLVSILVRGGRNSTVDSGVVGGQVRSGQVR